MSSLNSSIYPLTQLSPLVTISFTQYRNCLFILVTLRKEKFIAMVLKEKEGNKYNSKHFSQRKVGIDFFSMLQGQMFKQTKENICFLEVGVWAKL